MVKFLYDNFCQFPFDVTDVINDGNEYGSSELGSLCEGGKIVLFIFPAVGRLFNMAGFTLYYVPLNDLNWTLMQENIKKIIPTAVYIYILSNMTDNNWFVCILCNCKSNIDTGKIPSYKKYVSFNVTNKIIKCLLFSLDIVCSISF
jgi:hypothetical protein